ncbi:hypothetical protein G6F56_001622 [Rhizopus delemar]|nr:hypothetical protein G6F56_001622 [Rhizopus delemar]
MSLNPLIVSAQTAHTATVLWLHGLNNSSMGFSYIPEELGNLFPYVKWVLPNAPSRSMSFAEGFPMSAWFDVYAPNANETLVEDEQGMVESVDSVSALIKQEVDNGLNSSRIVIGGFSQGCVISLLTGLRSEYSLAGVVGYSGWVAMANTTQETASEANKKTPFLIGHGDADPVVNYKLGQSSVELLRSLDYNVTFKTYPDQGHIVSDAELEEFSRFLSRVIPLNE